jgi:hypothetical protein
MGATMMGSVQNAGNVDLLNPEQQQFLSQILSRSNDPNQFNQMFQDSFVTPAQQTLNRQIIPGIKESFLGNDSSGSSALNQALAQSATDIGTMLGTQKLNQYNTQTNQGIQGLGIKAFQPMIQENNGWLSDILSILAAGGKSFLGAK